MHGFEWYQVTCGNELEELCLLALFLKYDRKLPVEEQHF